MEYFRFGVKLTVVFFLLGTVILISFAVTLSARIALFAYQFTITAILVNWLYAAILLFHLLKRRLTLNTLFKTLGIMLINIPVGIFYSWLMVFLLSFARITFSNTTGEDLGPIRLDGCEQKEIRELKKGEEKTVWIKIPVPCSVTIAYKVNGMERKEEVIHSLDPAGGLQIEHELKKSGIGD